MARHGMTWRQRFAQWRCRSRTARVIDTEHRAKVREEAEQQAHRLRYQGHARKMRAHGASAAQIEAALGPAPFPERSPIHDAPEWSMVPLRPAVLRSPLPDTTPPTEAIPTHRWPQPYTFTPTRGDHP